MKKTILLCCCVCFLAVNYSCADEIKTDPLFVYDKHDKPDPFVPLVGIVYNEHRDIFSISDIKLQGITMDAQGKRIAVINDELYRAGDSKGEMLVLQVTPNEVIFSIQGKKYSKQLYDEY